MLEGVIEYDPATWIWQTNQDARLGLVEGFYCVDGHMEINGHTFTSDNIDRKK